LNFGTLLKEKRKQRNISLRKMSELVNLGYSYLSDIENDKKPAPNDKSVLLMADILHLSENERIAFFDSAAFSKDKDKNNFHIPVDISAYISSNEDIKSQIRHNKIKT
jgi:transcriptional regulator with XRE-family HTH domain